MKLLRRYPVTIGLIVLNTLVFIFIFLQAKTFREPLWTQTLLQYGALFNPYTLDTQWYRLFTHQFLHGHLLHLAINMLALYNVGRVAEEEAGSVKLLAAYVLSGIGGALASLYWNLFIIGVGASGAIFGLFGFSIVLNVHYSLRAGVSVKPIIINFVIFLAINLIFAQAMNVDNAAHFGGLLTGAIIGMFSVLRKTTPRKLFIEYALVPLFVVLYFMLPRFQVDYLKVFAKVIDIESLEKNLSQQNNATDADFLKLFKQQDLAWDTALMMLNSQKQVPEALQSDTFKLRHYIKLRDLEANHKITMLERESYIYYDSLGIVRDSIAQFLPFNYSLVFATSAKRAEPEARTPSPPPGETITALYDSHWVEIKHPPAVYYRIGLKDSAGRWQGPVTDYYANGTVQMKGSYKDDKRHGIFLYYSDHRTYTSAGRYSNDRSIGKWETFHPNGELESEIHYNNGYFLKNLWDASGNQLVRNGYGRVIVKHPTGAMKEEGEYKNGHKEGYWYGRHPNGEMYFEENYRQGRLINGRSKDLTGKIFLYDQSSFFPLPEGGYLKLRSYLDSETRKHTTSKKGEVRVSFRVTIKGMLTDVKIEEGLTPEINNIAKDILLAGPRWIPAREHGHQPVDGFSFVSITFD
jgi:membrane associated rhomboid family serine protease/antitoxin component YwqK of YwqJK toxin-antitoxin module